jgi:uncharacterized protein YdeI (YjbR/CyaY-like superfamily)
MNPKVDAFIRRESRWREEFQELRTIILDCQLEEELKWGQPCYACGGKNVVLMHGFKEYCAILFIKGSLLKDPKGILIQQTENVQAGRQVRFTDAQQIRKLEKTLKAYIREAVEIEKSGLRVEYKKTTDLAVPEEFQARLDKDGALKKAFESLTPGRQKAYIFYFAQAKQSKTREARIEKCAPRIIDGLGLDD